MSESSPSGRLLPGPAVRMPAADCTSTNRATRPRGQRRSTQRLSARRLNGEHVLLMPLAAAHVTTRIGGRIDGIAEAARLA
jgi:hypothetical protein